MKKAIELKNLTKKFKNRTAVDHLSFGIEQGQFLGLLGQNGAGKTTTVKMLCGLFPPTNGDAFLLGDSIVQNPNTVKKRIGISPQETAVAPKLSVLENLTLIARLHGAPHKEAAKKAKEYMSLLGLSDRAKDKAKSLSGGMQRRLSIAMALITEPKVLFLDEPTLGLDVRARRELWNVIRDWKGKLNIVLTTHYLEEAEELSDHIVILHNGRMQAEGTVDDLLSQTNATSLEDAFLQLTEPEVTA